MRIGVTAGVLVRVLAEVLIDGALVVDAVLLEGVMKELMAGRAGVARKGGTPLLTRMRVFSSCVGVTT